MKAEYNDDNVIEFPGKRQVEQINGIRMDLGRMAIEELQLLEVQVSQRWLEVHDDLTIIRDTLARRSPDRPEGAA